MKNEMKSRAGKWLKEVYFKHKIVVGVLLIVFGSLLLWCSLLASLEDKIKNIFVTIGATLIASGIATFIIAPMEKDIVKGIHEDVMTTLDIAKDCENCGVIRVFENRRRDEEFPTYLEKNFKGNEILMMGTTLKDFFKRDAPYQDLFLDALTSSKTKFGILLLDPTSNAAKDAAAIDQGEEYSDESKYKDSWLYTDIKEITEILYGLYPQHKGQLDIRYTTRLPHTFVIQTNFFTFIEYYDMGKLNVLSENEILDPHKTARSFGGYTPCFLVENSSKFARLVVSYLKEELNNPKNKTLEKVAEDLEITEGDKK